MSQLCCDKRGFTDVVSNKTPSGTLCQLPLEKMGEPSLCRHEPYSVILSRAKDLGAEVVPLRFSKIIRP
jgi:hypothetical protein